MRTLIAQPVTWLFVIVVIVGVAVAYLANQPSLNPGVKYSGRVPDVLCPAGVTPAESFCYVTEPPLGSKMPDTNVPASTAPQSAP